MKEVENRINQYLDEIKSNLEYLSDEDINEIITSVRSHISDELEIHGQGQPTLETVEAVLMNMDPPESYSESLAELKSHVPKSKPVSRFGVFGAILLPFGIIAAFMLFMVSPSSGHTATTLWQWIARLTILPLGILAPFVCTAFGLIGISQIRNSGGALIGMPLVFFISLFYPIIILDFVVFWIVAAVYSTGDLWNIILPACLVFLLLLDSLIIRAAWKATKSK